MFAILIETETPKAGIAIPTNRPDRVVQLTVEGEGQVSATAVVYVSNDNKFWFNSYEITAQGENIAGGHTPPHSVGWAYMKAEVTALTGQNAKATVTLGMAS